MLPPVPQWYPLDDFNKSFSSSSSSVVLAVAVVVVVVVVVSLGFTTLLKSQITCVSFYSEREQFRQILLEALVSA